MKPRSVVVALALSWLVALAACEKASNVNALQEEATATNAYFAAKFDALGQQLVALEQRMERLPPTAQRHLGYGEVARLRAEARSELTALQSLARQTPRTIETMAKAPDARVQLINAIDQLDEHYEDGFTKVNQKLATIVSWLAYLELTPEPAPEPAPAAEPSPADPVPTEADAEPSPAEPAPAGAAAAPAPAAPAADPR